MDEVRRRQPQAAGLPDHPAKRKVRVAGQRGQAVAAREWTAADLPGAAGESFAVCWRFGRWALPVRGMANATGIPVAFGIGGLDGRNHRLAIPFGMSPRTSPGRP